MNGKRWLFLQCHSVPSTCANHRPFSPAHGNRCRNSVSFIFLQYMTARVKEGKGRNQETLWRAQVRKGAHWQPRTGILGNGGARLEQLCYPEGPSQHGDALGKVKQKIRVKGLPIWYLQPLFGLLFESVTCNCSPQERCWAERSN